MSQDEKRRGPFDNDDLDEEVRAADDTGMIAQQQEINIEEASLPEDVKDNG